MDTRFAPVLVTFSLVLASLACGGGAGRAPGAEVPTPLPPTATAIPIPPQPSAPGELPSDSDLRALILYANQMQPILAQAGAILERDGQILKQAEDGNDAVLCDGQLSTDNAAMKSLVLQVQAISAPSDARAIHDLVIQSGTAWTEALDEVETFCDTGNPLYKVTAAVKLWEAGVALQDAGNRFWLLLMSEGVEDWVQR